MKLNFVKWIGAVCVCGSLVASAQEAGEVEKLRQQLQELQRSFEQVVREQRQQIETLQQQVEQLQARQPASPEAAMAAAVMAGPAEPADPARKAWSPTDPIRVGKGGAYMDIGLVGTFAAGGSTARDIEGGTQLGGHDPNQRGFTVQGVEVSFSGAVDPYFRGSANVLFSVDSDGESYTELEEAWLETMALPGNLQVRAGQFLTDFGRLNVQHPHQWAFVDTPLVNARFLGADGLRNPGARVSWLMPTPFYSELFLAVQNSHGEGASSFRDGGHSHGGHDDHDELPFGYRHADNDRGVRGLGDLLFAPRYALSFDLTESQTLLLGTSAAFGPNSSGGAGDTTTHVYGLDFFWKWKPAKAHGGFPFVSLQTEGMMRRYELGAFDWAGEDEPLVFSAPDEPAALGRETVTDYGFYSQMLYGFRKGWVVGLRYDYVTGERADYEKLGLTDHDGELLGRDPLRRQRWRISPNLTWYPSEYSKIRLQYNYDDRADVGVDHSVWLQWELLLGAHAAHKF